MYSNQVIIKILLFKKSNIKNTILFINSLVLESLKFVCIYFFGGVFFLNYLIMICNEEYSIISIRDFKILI